MSFWTVWVWDAPHIAVAVLESVAGWYAVHWARRGVSVDLWPGHDTTPPDNHRMTRFCHCAICKRARAERVKAGKPPLHLRSYDELTQLAPHTKDYRCTNCGNRCRHDIHHPGYDHHMSSDVALCNTCFALVPENERNDLGKWMGFNIVRTI